MLFFLAWFFFLFFGSFLVFSGFYSFVFSDNVSLFFLIFLYLFFYFLSLCMLYALCFIIVVDFKLLCKRYPGFCKFFPLIFCITNNSQDSSGLTDLLEKGWEDPYRSLRERDLSLTLKLDEIRINPNEIELN